MLSTSVIKNVSQASHYFSSSDNYYTNEEGQAQSEWYGKGARALSLSRNVNPERFSELLQGILPTGERLGKMVEGELKHRAGWDLTFSAPKSVSVMALIGGDHRLVEAHREAVSVTLSHIERDCSEARHRIGDNIHFEKTGNMIAALYHHDLSRAQDPQLHTHSVIMNITQRDDGQWRSMASALGRYDKETESAVYGFIERVRNNKRYFGKLYESELAFRVRELGYEIAVGNKNKVFEIAEVPVEVNRFFSKRREDIESYLNERGLSGSKSAEIATLNTRESKKTPDRDTLSKEWRDAIKTLQFDSGALKKKAIENQLHYKIPKGPVLNKTAIALMHETAEALSVFKTTFSLEELITHSVNNAMTENLRVDQCVQAAEHLVNTGVMIAIDQGDGKKVFMSQKTLQQEQAIIQVMQHQKSLENSLFSAAIKKHTGDHADHLADIFGTSPFVFVDVQKDKEEAIKNITSIIKQSSCDMTILGPNKLTSLKAADAAHIVPATLFEKIKQLFSEPIKHEGVTSFFHRQDTKPPDVLLVDNSHLLSMHQLSTLVSYADTHASKIIFLGNAKGLLSKQTSFSLDRLTEYGLKTVSWSASPVVSTEETLSQSLHKLHDHIIQSTYTEDRLSLMVQAWGNLPKESRKTAFLTSPQAKTVKKLNEEAHQALKDKGELKESIILPILLPVFALDMQLKKANFYKQDMIVRFNEPYTSLGVSRGAYLRVVSHSNYANTVILKDNKNRMVSWNPEKIARTRQGAIELFTEKQQEFCIRESVKITRNNGKMMKGERFILDKVHKQQVTLKGQGNHNRSLKIPFQQLKHIDYGYADTLHGIAHETPSMIFIDLPASAFSTNQRQVFQALAQSKETWVYTDSLPKLVGHLQKATGDKELCHDILMRSQATKASIQEFYNTIEKQITNNQDSRPAITAVLSAMQHLGEREAAFSHQALLQEAMHRTMGEFQKESLEAVVTAMERSGLIFQGKVQDKSLWTTVESLQQEREILRLSVLNKGHMSPVSQKVPESPKNHNLTPEQHTVIQRILQSRDRVMAIQGYPGTGKTTLLMQLQEQLTKRGYELIGLAPTHTAVKELTSRGITASTADQYLLDHAQTTEKFTHKIIVLDESSMVSNKKMLAILNFVHDKDSRLIVLGDTRQLPAIEAGKPQTLIQSQVETAHLTDIRRQKDPTLKQAVKETIDYEFSSAMTTLEKSIIEIKNDKDESRLQRLTQLVDDYFSYSKSLRPQIQIITPGHDDKKIVNELIRERLVIEGSLQGSARVFPVLISQNLTQVEKSTISNFEMHDVLRFNRYQSPEIKAGDYLTVKEVHREQQLLTLINKEGEEVFWQVPKPYDNKSSPIEVFSQEQRELRTGDSIRFSRTDKEKEFFSSRLATVLEIKNNNITLITDDKKISTVNLSHSRFHHWDHGYAATVYATQGMTKSIVLAHLESYRDNLTTQPAFLVALTRTVDTFKVYTDNKEQLINTIERNSGIKKSSVEIIHRSLPEQKNIPHANKEKIKTMNKEIEF